MESTLVKVLGSTLGNELRELAVTLKRVGISPTQCATGFRVATMSQGKNEQAC